MRAPLSLCSCRARLSCSRVMSPSRTRISPIRSELAAGAVKCATPPGGISVCSWVERTSRRFLYGNDEVGGKRLPAGRASQRGVLQYLEPAEAHRDFRKDRVNRDQRQFVWRVL